MSTTLYPYYEKELHFIRHEAEEFAKQYPAAAGQLLLERNQSRDPHVERLIEAFALLTARVEKKLDDDFPEITEGMLTALYPHYLAPIPSMAVAQFEADPSSPQPTGLPIPRGAGVRSQPVGGAPCRYQTCYPVTLWPIRVAAASVDFPPFDTELKPPAKTAAVLRISLEADADLLFSQLSLDTLRLHLSGDDHLMATLYEQLMGHATRVEVRSGDKEKRLLGTLGGDAIQPVGFAEDEGLLPYPPQSSHAYRLLTELFSFPQKFAFIDIQGLAATLPEALDKIDLVIYLDEADERLAGEVTADTLRLGCTPIVNLFPKVCEPIRLTHAKTEYPIHPDAQHRDKMEVYRIERVTGVGAGSTTRFAPLYGLDHENSWAGQDEVRAYWHARRRPAARHDDAGTDMSLRLTDLDFHPTQPAEQSVTVQALCTNRDLPRRLPSGPAGLKFEMESSYPVRGVRCLRQPTAPMRPPLDAGAHWRLISHLSLNHLSLGQEELAAPTLQEILRLYDFADRNANRKRAIANSEMIDGVVGVGARNATCRIGGPKDGGFCRGVAVELELDEQNYRDTGVYLFASVLERFFAEYATVNSFTRLTLKTKQRGKLKTWAPRAGATPLV
ncbi:hypothetical protein Mal64_04540 [Pseudobythopirellula maris]|uniref:Type VI secretion system baseplate subunit TssF n=1 Tax=Pseudobythopirellula maris TaxID=2527991 RepID=A0A5C5ZTC0_9BACT|nr:type VI secretion system baseplate subunit TssF [Pseudobythopirellula maris]TWT90071.1 hypothetical protein Mal64_04540 [Pseudobythopirellula maris]